MDRTSPPSDARLLGGRILERRSHAAPEGAAWTSGAKGLPGGWGEGEPGTGRG